ncbi:MAG: hypothetical protein ACRD1C_00245 [Terriglobales bacterium]
MPLLHRAPAPRPPAGVLASRRLADAALLRLFSRARRRAAPLVLLRAARTGLDGSVLPFAFLETLVAQVRIGDLVWQEPGAEVLMLLEETDDATAVEMRLRLCAARTGLELEMHTAQFPRQGVTVERLLEEVGWHP